MTSIVTGLGVLPLAVGMGDPGRDVERPMAVVILGGLLGLYQLGVGANNFRGGLGACRQSPCYGPGFVFLGSAAFASLMNMFAPIVRWV
jgi:hypothetical protein